MKAASMAKCVIAMGPGESQVQGFLNVESLLETGAFNSLVLDRTATSSPSACTPGGT